MSDSSDDEKRKEGTAPRPKASPNQGKPPKRHQFKSGQSGNPSGIHRRRKNADETNFEEILNEPVRVVQNGKTVEMSPFESGMRHLAKSALNEDDITAALKFVSLCEANNALKAPEKDRGGSVVIIPVGWDDKEWLAMYARYGNPPWPGKRHGMTYDMEQAEKERKSKPKKRGRPQGSTKNQKVTDCTAIAKKVAFEKHKVAGRKNRCTVIDLILNMIRNASAKGDYRAMKAWEELLDRHGAKQGGRRGGLLVIQEHGRTDEELEKLLADRQRKHREPRSE